ncbi:hypothetical protein MKX08_001621 [Trichoderma sp. CBMAI-0020]|nr:hypothetical protein MKX08_001621 [Trichoderma sp. CBMAI-0020]
MAHIVFSSFEARFGSWACKTGRTCDSITQILRKTTVAVKAAYATWWKMGSLEILTVIDPASESSPTPKTTENVCERE